jgi:hypothetical protein
VISGLVRASVGGVGARLVILSGFFLNSILISK